MNEAATSIGELTPQPSSSREDTGLRNRLRVDRFASRLVGASGFTIILVILAIFLVIAAEVAPLFRPAQVTLLDVRDTGETSPIFGMGTDEYRNTAFVVSAGGIRFHALQDQDAFPPLALPDLQGERIVAASPPQGGMVLLGLSGGRALPVKIHFEVTFPGGVRMVTPRGEVMDFLSFTNKTIPLLAHHSGPKGFVAAAVTGPREVTVVAVTRKKNLMGVVRTRQKRRRFQLPNKGEITALAVGHELNSVYAGTASGQIIRMGLPAGALEKSVDVIGATPDPAVAVTLLRFLHGGSTLIAGDQKGRVFSAQVVRGKKNIFRVEWVHAFQAHAHPVTLISYSQRDKGFVTGDASGLLQYHYATSGQTEYTLASGLPGDLAGLVLAPKGDGLLALDRNGRLGHWRVDHPHPGITWNALFGEVRYEGYSDAQYMWQSTGGTDEFEPKFSLVPLIFGTLKGTFYALFFAAPLALLAAFYASQFMHRSLMRVVKPTVEYMAALPSVVLGFLGALWLAPRVEELLPSMLLMPLVVLLMVFAFRFLSDFTEMKHLITQRPGVEFWILLALVLGGGVLAVFLGEWCEAVFFGGDFRPWVRSTLGLTYDQRNSLVVGMAMGFSVVPIIFTIAEDSLSSVPQHLTAASLALGATRWQTALRVVLPTASPGIFSGVMIGFGRAVGETMIVLMATGNTPVMDLSPFTGFRALSANIAVELPEAPEGGTLFRVLFLAVLILFFFTFAVNTLAEGVRLKLRAKYRVL